MIEARLVTSSHRRRVVPCDPWHMVPPGDAPPLDGDPTSVTTTLTEFSGYVERWTVSRWEPRR